ncbi:MAG: alpha/beta fold hydrolase [Sphingomicrobium sp.]
MGKLMTSEGTIGVEARGSGSAVPIVFLHGVGSDKSVWHPQLAHLSISRPAIAFDYPGYGESDPRPSATRDDFAAAILAAMDSMAIERAHICGLSLGGVIAIAIHAAAPARCASLILADTFAVHPDGRAIYDRSIAASRDIGMRALAEARAGALLGSAATDTMRREVVDTMSKIDPAAYACGAEAVWLADQSDRVGTIAIPTLILCGNEDSITPPALSDDLASAISGATFALIARCGHLANFEQPDTFNRLVEQFLADQAA